VTAAEVAGLYARDGLTMGQASSKLYSGPELRLNSVPPAPTTFGSEAGKLTARCEQSS
jgi:hypothetical protein